MNDDTRLVVAGLFGLVGLALFVVHLVLVVLNWSEFWHLITTPSGQMWWLFWFWLMSDLCDLGRRRLRGSPAIPGGERR